jgi:ABC-type multidrug transport system fused ATPase/permease subunit
MKQLLYFFRIYRKYLSNKVWWLLVLTTVVAFADGLGISMLLPLLQSLEVSDTASKDNILFELTDLLGVTGSLTGILAFMFLIFLGKAVLKFATGYYRSNLYKELFRYLKINFYDAILKVDYQYFTKRNAGYFVTVMETHTNRLIRSFNFFVLLITSIVMTFSYLFMAALISWQVSLMAVILGGIILGLLTFVNRYVKRISRKISNEETKMSQIAIQALYSFKYIISTASYKPIQQQYNKSIEILTGLQFKNQLANAFTDSLQELLSITLLIAMILIEVVVLGYPIGAVFVVLLLFYRGVNQLLGIQKNWQKLIENQGFVESVDQEFERLKRYRVTDGTAHELPPLNQGKLSLEALSFHYQDDDKPVLKNLQIDIAPNTTVAFVGTSGAGKTTLVDIITGLLKPQLGHVKLDNILLEDIQKDVWRSKIGYVAQDLTIFDDTIANNISLFEEAATQEKVKRAATMASAIDFIEELPKGFQTKIGDNGVRLSGGQKQRLFIARELYKKPDLLILDEATSALDSESERYIQDSIDKLKGKITVIIIAHRLSTIRNVDNIYVLEKGRVVESGPYEELISKKESRFSKMIELQSF